MVSPINSVPGSTGINSQSKDNSGASKISDATSRIQGIREQIKNGSYSVNFEQLATAIITSGEVRR